MSTQLRANARAKLNLSLHIIGKRADGYHLLDSLVAFADVADVVEVQSAPELSLTVNGEFAPEAGASDKNLVLRAAQLLRAHTGCVQGAAMQLTKNLPVGGGLGGGSADAAAALQLLNRLWALGLSDETLAQLGLQLGADVPMCLHGKAARIGGIGEEILPVHIPSMHAVLVHPHVPLLTKDVYAALQLGQHAPTYFVDVSSAAELRAWLKSANNDLERVAINLQPAVASVLAAIEQTQPQLARMSGSGACCFGLYDSQAAAEHAAATLRAQHPHWWVCPTMVQ